MLGINYIITPVVLPHQANAENPATTPFVQNACKGQDILMVYYFVKNATRNMFPIQKPLP
jgi:hypothetical protein